MLAEVKPWLPPKSKRDFDADPELLPLPNGLVADLRQGRVRAMRREDCQTKRLTIMPVDMPTPRWDRFKREITCGDTELEGYIVRLMTLAITGMALHLLIFFYGCGRNGKGALLRLLEKILGGEIFAVAIRPDEVQYKRGSDERDKRLMGRLRGKRLAYTGETVSGQLDWTLLKTLTGGDTLSGAEVYENTKGFTPSHTLILTTNDRPKLPVTVAFRERLRFVPFNGDFSKSKDFTLERDLEKEAPGILYQLIKAAPDALTNGDEPPASVREATDDVMAENDVAQPFIDARLIDDVDAVTPLSEMEAEIVRVGYGAESDRVLAGIRTRWRYAKKRVHGKEVRGLVGVRIRRKDEN